MCDTDEILKSLGLAYIKDVESGSSPQLTNMTFADIVKKCDCKEFCSKKLYPHQLETFKYLSQGKSVILVSSTGSGKTEAWLSYFFSKPEIKALAIYPTKALTNDQAHRIAGYAMCMGFSVYRSNGVIYGDVVRYDGDTSKNRDVKNSLSNAKIILTNPEMIVTLLKKNLSRLPFRPNLIVLDEIDFYESHNATLLIVLLKKLYPETQFVIMSGTLSNPDDLRAYLGNAKIVSGKGFKLENRTYIVLGYEKDLSDLYNQYKDVLSSEFNVRDGFENKVMEIYFELAESNLRNPSLKNLKSDILEKFRNFANNKATIENLLKSYKNCKGELTIAFFNSISECESYGRQLGIPTHHSKIRKKLRDSIEEDLRQGKINEVFTVKTLQQGIDIGYAKRIIHVGFPISVKDFLQREGRKGRRESIGFTESIIIPLFIDPRIRKGIDSLKIWRNLPPEVIIFNDSNAYVTKWLQLIDNILKGNYRYLEQLDKLRFYEFKSKPVNIKLIDDKGQLVDIDKASYKDLIEYYQKGSIDFATNAIVEKIDTGKTTKLFNVIEKYPNNIGDECIKDAIQEYEYIVRQWNTEPDFELDIKLGKVISRVSVDIYFNGEGYVEFNELPDRVRWYIESRNKIQKPDGSYDYAYAKIELENHGCDVFPKNKGYKGYTYAYSFEIGDLDYVDEGMAFIITVLRLYYGVKIDLINYTLSGKILKVWELTPTGLLAKIREENFVINNQRLDFNTFKNYLENVKIDDIFKIIFYSIFPVRGVDFKKARKKAIDLAFKLFGYATILFNKPVSVTVKPNVVIIDSITGKTNNVNVTYYGLTYYDTQNSREEVKVFNSYDKFIKELAYLVYTLDISEVVNGGNVDLNKKKMLNEIRILEKIKEKYGYEVTPSDFSQKIREYMNKLTDPNVKMNENEIKELFKERARIYQGLRNLLESDEKQR